MRRIIRSALIAAVALLIALPAHAQKADDTLRIAWRDSVPDIDPYHNQLRTGLIVAMHAWDTLIYRDPETFQLKPLLSTTWRFVDPTTIEFDLRPGVVFHDGSPFTADDVVYTVEQVLSDPKVAVRSNFAFLAGAERVDELHVRLHLKRVFPAALEYIAITLPILPKATRTAAGADFSHHPVGTGPYRITSVDAGRIEMERNDTYFDSPKGRPAIARLRIEQVSDSAAELAALLDGRADWIWQSSPDQTIAIARVPTLQVLRSESMRFGFVNMDAAGRTGPDSPFQLLLVRQAVAAAIDRVAMAKQFMPGGARVLDAPCFPTQFGCDQAAAGHVDYDPDRAKALLTEAGFPNGFDTKLTGYLLPPIQAALGQYLAAVGIRAEVVNLPTGEAVRRSVAGQNAIDVGSWGSYSINDASAVLPYFFTGGDQDYARDPEVAQLLAAGGSTTDPDDRRAAYGAAIRRIGEQAFMLPLFTFVTNYGVSRQLSFKPAADELPRFFQATWR